MQNGELTVLDYELQRLSFFQPGSGFVSSTRVNVFGPLRVFPAADSIWITSAIDPGSDEPRAVAINRAGEQIGQAPPRAEDARLFGGVINIAVGATGSLILPDKRPGLWELWRSGEPLAYGQELVPGLTPPTVRQEGRNTIIGGTEAWTAAVCELENGSVLVWYNTATLDARGFPLRDTIRDHFVLFDKDGARLGTVTLPPGVTPYPWSLYVSPVTHHVFMALSEPFPTVLELRIEQATPG